MNIFNFEDYKLFLNSMVKSKSKGFVSRLAQAAGCQRSYMSQVLNSHIQLTPDHAAGICEFLEFTDPQGEYFLSLVELERAGTEQLKRMIRTKLRKMLENEKRLSKKLDRKNKKVREDFFETYYSAWYYSAIHISTSIEKLEKASDIAKYLSLDLDLTSEVLRRLFSWGLVNKNGGKWEYNFSAHLHLEDSSPFTRMNHMNWRSYSMTQPLDFIKNVHYSTVFTVSKSDYGVLRDELISFIEKQRRHIGNSGSEKLVSFNCDLFSPNFSKNS